MPFIVNYQMGRYQDRIKYSSVIKSVTDKPSFRFRFWVAKVRGPALFKDGLNFDERPLKIIGFCKQCFDKLYALLK